MMTTLWEAFLFGCGLVVVIGSLTILLYMGFELAQERQGEPPFVLAAQMTKTGLHGPVHPGGVGVAVTVTGYCWHAPCINQESAHGQTASGTQVRRGVCAADWRTFPVGTIFDVPGYGRCRVEDTGRLVQGRHLDLYFDDIADAREWGRREQVVRLLHYGL